MSLRVNILSENTNVKELRELIEDRFPEEVLEFYQSYLSYVHEVNSNKDDVDFARLAEINKKFEITEGPHNLDVNESKNILENSKYSPVITISDNPNMSSNGINDRVYFESIVSEAANSLSIYLLTGEDYDEWKNNYKKLMRHYKNKDNFSVSITMELGLNTGDKFTSPKLICTFSPP